MARLGLIGFSLALEAAEGWRNAVPSLGLVPFSTSLAAGAPLPPVAPLPVNWAWFSMACNGLVGLSLAGPGSVLVGALAVPLGDAPAAGGGTCRPVGPG